MPSVQAKYYQVGVVGQPCAFGPTVSKRYSHAQQRAALSSTLASRRSEQQNKINDAVALQNLSEEDWLQSVHAEADAEAQSRPHSRVCAPTRPSTSRFHQADGPGLRLDRTQLGRNMLQRKVDNFSEMVALVSPPKQLPPEAPTAAQRPHPQQPIALYAATAYRTPAAPPSSAHPPKGPTLSSSSAEKQAAPRNTSNFSKARLIPDGTVYNPLVPATAISDPHLRRLHDTATAWKHSLRQQPDLSSLDTATAAQEAALAQPDTVLCRPPGRFSSQVPPVRVSSVCRSDQKHPFVAAQANTSRNTGLQQLQEPPAERQYRFTSDATLCEPGSRNQSAPSANANTKHTTATRDAQEMHQCVDRPGSDAPQHHKQHSSRCEDIAKSAASYDAQLTLENLPASSPSTRLADIPPPPSRPTEKPKSSWWAAIKGDAPPWLL